MGHYHDQAIFNLEQDVFRLQEKEDRCRAMLASSLTSPEVCSQASAELGLTIERIKAANEEIARLRSEI
jgi:hypothetical protein